QLVHLLVEEHVDGNRAVASVLEELVHQIRILVAQEDPHLDLRRTLHKLDHVGKRGDGRPTPVLGDDEDPPSARASLQDLGVAGGGGDRLECGEEALLVHGHLIEVLAHRQALLEPLLRHHDGASLTSVRALVTRRAAKVYTRRLAPRNLARPGGTWCRGIDGRGRRHLLYACLGQKEGWSRWAPSTRSSPWCATASSPGLGNRAPPCPRRASSAKTSR